MRDSKLMLDPDPDAYLYNGYGPATLKKVPLLFKCVIRYAEKFL
jgi:hypothetical protein